MKVSLTPDLACDVWTSHLRDRSLVLGGDDLTAYHSGPSLKLTGDSRCTKARPAHARYRELDRS